MARWEDTGNRECLVEVKVEKGYYIVEGSGSEIITKYSLQCSQVRASDKGGVARVISDGVDDRKDGRDVDKCGCDEQRRNVQRQRIHWPLNAYSSQFLSG